MGWFKLLSKRRQAKPLALHRERTANKIAEKILAVQRSTAAKLNAQAQKMGVKKVGFLLGTVLFGFALYCAYLVLGAFF